MLELTDLKGTRHFNKHSNDLNCNQGKHKFAMTAM